MKKPRNSDADRYARYQRVLDALVTEDSLSLADVKARLSHEIPVFVTRVVHELQGQGFLRETDKRHFEWTRPRQDLSIQGWIEKKVFGPRVARTPEGDRPRERLLALGPAELRIADLLAILIRSGRPGESVIQAGEKIAARFSETVERLATASKEELKDISSAVIMPAYCQIIAGIELGRRIERAAQARSQQTPDRIRGAADAVAFCQRKFQRLAEDGVQEEFRLVCLDAKHQLIDTHVISVGLLSESLVAPREAFRQAIRDAAAAVILVHNHPSGDPTPSLEDLAVTRRLEQAAQTLGIKFLDHVIVARQGCLSIREHMRTGV